MPGMERLHLEDAFEDGPQTRNLLTLFEADALMLRSYVLSLYRCFSRVVAAQKEVCAATQSLSSHLKAYDQQRFPLESDESILSSTLSQFSIFLDELSSVQQVLLTQLSDNTIFPISRFLKNDLDEILSLKEVFQSASDEHEQSLATYMKFPKKKEQDKSRQEVVDELYIARKKSHQTCLHYYTALNSLQYKRKSSLLEPLVGLMNAQKTFFEIGRESVIRKEVDEFVGNINASVLGVQSELKEASQTMRQQIETIEQNSIHRYYAEPLPDMPHVSPNCNLSQKAGYLFLRTKLTLLSSRWDRCYFFIQGGNLMCQTKDEVAGSPVLDLNEPNKTEIIEIEDRRFVFQIVQLSNKKTVILQAENAFERDEWIATIANASKEKSSVGEMLSAVDGQGVRSTPERQHGSTSENSSSSISAVLASVPAAVPKVLDMLRDASGFGRSTQPNMAPSTPSEGTFFPDAPIQFDIIAPCEDAKLSRPDGSDGVPRRINPFNSRLNAADDDSHVKHAVRFLGSQQVNTDRGDAVIMETVRQIMAARAIYNVFKMTEFQLTVSSNSLRLFDPANGNITAEFTLPDVSYWAVHNENKRLFGFITHSQDNAASDKSAFTCYIFECTKSGEEICHALTTAAKTAFNLSMQKQSENVPATEEKELLLANIRQLQDKPDLPSLSTRGNIVLDESRESEEAASVLTTTVGEISTEDRHQEECPSREKPA